MNSQADWDDLRFFLALARQGSLSGAARGLMVTHSTVLRRIAGFEERLGVSLFDRLPSGFVLTAAGDDLLPVAVKIEEEVLAATRRLSGQDAQFSGSLRVTTIDIMALSLLPPHLAAFRAAYPEISVELVVHETPFSLTRREADVAIRSTNNPPDNLVGRSIAGMAFAIYGSRDYLAGPGAEAGADLTRHAWIGFDESFDPRPMGRWVKQQIPPERIGVRANSVAVLRSMAAAGLGLALLPCAIGDIDEKLRRVGPVLDDVSSKVWLLTHEDLRRMGRVRVFLDFMAAALGRDRDLLEGRRPLR